MTTIGFGDLEPTFQGTGDESYESPIFGFTSAILAVYRFIIIAWMFFGISFMSAIFR